MGRSAQLLNMTVRRILPFRVQEASVSNFGMECHNLDWDLSWFSSLLQDYVWIASYIRPWQSHVYSAQSSIH
jgi:hypothetical protein